MQTQYPQYPTFVPPAIPQPTLFEDLKESFVESLKWTACIQTGRYICLRFPQTLIAMLTEAILTGPEYALKLSKIDYGSIIFGYVGSFVIQKTVILTYYISLKLLGDRQQITNPEDGIGTKGTKLLRRNTWKVITGVQKGVDKVDRVVARLLHIRPIQTLKTESVPVFAYSDLEINRKIVLDYLKEFAVNTASLNLAMQVVAYLGLNLVGSGWFLFNAMNTIGGLGMQLYLKPDALKSDNLHLELSKLVLGTSDLTHEDMCLLFLKSNLTMVSSDVKSQYWMLDDASQQEYENLPFTVIDQTKIPIELFGKTFYADPLEITFGIDRASKEFKEFAYKHLKGKEIVRTLLGVDQPLLTKMMSAGMVPEKEAAIRRILGLSTEDNCQYYDEKLCINWFMQQSNLMTANIEDQVREKIAKSGVFESLPKTTVMIKTTDADGKESEISKKIIDVTSPYFALVFDEKLAFIEEIIQDMQFVKIVEGNSELNHEQMTTLFSKMGIPDLETPDLSLLQKFWRFEEGYLEDVFNIPTKTVLQAKKAQYDSVVKTDPLIVKKDVFPNGIVSEEYKNNGFVSVEEQKEVVDKGTIEFKAFCQKYLTAPSSIVKMMSCQSEQVRETTACLIGLSSANACADYDEDKFIEWLIINNDFTDSSREKFAKLITFVKESDETPAIAQQKQSTKTIDEQNKTIRLAREELLKDFPHKEVEVGIDNEQQRILTKEVIDINSPEFKHVLNRFV